MSNCGVQGCEKQWTHVVTIVYEENGYTYETDAKMCDSHALEQ